MIKIQPKSKAKHSSFHVMLTLSPCPAPGAQGPADGNSSPEHGGGAFQSAALPGANTLPLGEHFHAGIWRPQD